MTGRIPFLALSASLLLHAAAGFFTFSTNAYEQSKEEAAAPVMLRLSAPVTETEKIEELLPEPMPLSEEFPPEPEKKEAEETTEEFIHDPVPEEIPEEHAEETMLQENVPSPPNPRPVNEADLLSHYASQLREQIASEKRYPAPSRRREEEGTVVVRFSLNSQGELTDEPLLIQACGYSRLDKAALNAVIRGAPYPPRPDDLSKEVLDFQIPIKFYLK